ncbi:hypothetical protein AVEN_220074-1 [Araneus ventricosus]|uniref:DUF19 domain-containing protein n=1 Tax=Araneus ventricosus TaxID=182803 RepID=A0A4Y2R1Q1_ARAVE|nr:hypothetical protein AVEN_220074-1 [Araneus ventricosus]
MMLLALILSCMIAGSLACSDDHCEDRVLADELMAVKFLPNNEQLGILCPKVLTYLECEKDFFECPGRSLEELASSSDKTEATRAKAMLGGMSLVRDLCDEDSSFHHDYLGSVDCFRGFIEEALRTCRQDAVAPIEKFFDELYHSEEDISEEAYAEIHCLSDALELSCIIDNLGDSCGTVAQRTAMTALERVKALLKAGCCADVEIAADLKSRFLDFLELEDGRKSAVQGILDLLKRRR